MDTLFVSIVFLVYHTDHEETRIKTDDNIGTIIYPALGDCKLLYLFDFLILMISLPPRMISIQSLAMLGIIVYVTKHQEHCSMTIHVFKLGTYPLTYN